MITISSPSFKTVEIPSRSSIFRPLMRIARSLLPTLKSPKYPWRWPVFSPTAFASAIKVELSLNSTSCRRPIIEDISPKTRTVTFIRGNLGRSIRYAFPEFPSKACVHRETEVKKAATVLASSLRARSRIGRASSGSPWSGCPWRSSRGSRSTS